MSQPYRTRWKLQNSWVNNQQISSAHYWCSIFYISLSKIGSLYDLFLFIFVWFVDICSSCMPFNMDSTEIWNTHIYLAAFIAVLTQKSHLTHVMIFVITHIPWALQWSCETHDLVITVWDLEYPKISLTPILLSRKTTSIKQKQCFDIRAPLMDSIVWSEWLVYSWPFSFDSH